MKLTCSIREEISNTRTLEIYVVGSISRNIICRESFFCDASVQLSEEVSVGSKIDFLWLGH